MYKSGHVKALSVEIAITGDRKCEFFPLTLQQGIHFSILFRNATGRSSCVRQKYLQHKPEMKTED
jgi:hypothetical protein